MREPEQPTLPGIRQDCPVWHSRLLNVVQDGISIKCKSCRGQFHSISRTRILAAWAELDEQAQKNASDVA